MNLKKIAGLVLFFMTGSALATPVNMACITEFPTTTFIALTEGETINFRLVHHNGTKYMPIWNNVITPHDISVIAEAGKVLSDLGPDISFDMPQDSCEVQDGFLINCFGSSPTVEMGGHQVRMWAAYTKETQDVSFAGVYSYVTTNITLDVDGKSYHIPMRYESRECFKDLFSKNITKKLKSKNLILK